MKENKDTQNKFIAITSNIGFEIRTTLQLSLKYLKEILRSKLFIIIAIALPAILMIFMGVIFGGPLSGVQTFNILVINEDVGYTSYDYGDSLISTLEAVTYPIEDGDEPVNIFNVFEHDYYNQSVEDYLLYEDHDLHLTLVIPENFSQVVFNFDDDVKVLVVGDPKTGTYHSSLSAFSSILEGYVKAIRVDLGDTSGETMITENHLDIARNTTVFDLMVPGFVIIGIVMNIVFVASVLTEEYEQKTLEKLQLSPMRTIHLIGGLSISQLLVATVQIIVLFLLALVFGYNAIGSYVLAGLVILVMSISMSAIGMIVASIAKKTSIAGSISSVVAIPLYMITFFPVWGIGTIPMFEINGNVFGVFDLLPTNLATNMVNQVMVYGQTFSDISFQFVSLIIVTLIYLSIGLVLVSLLRLRPKKE